MVNCEALKHVLVELNCFLKEMNLTHRVWKSFVVSFFVSCYLVGNQHQEVVIFFGKAREAKECESEGAESSRDVALVIWLKWKFLALACNGLQSRDVVITHSRYWGRWGQLLASSIYIYLALVHRSRSHRQPSIQDGGGVCRLFAAWFFLLYTTT